MLLVLSIVPLVGAVNLSLHDRILMYPTASFVGLNNFKQLMGDPRFWNSLRVSLAWEVLTVIGSLFLGTTIALILFRNIGKRLQIFLGILFILPMTLPRVAAAYIWRFMYTPTLGVLNYFLVLGGIGPVEFISDPRIALFAIGAIDIWQWSFFVAILMLSLFECLPRGPMEAALLDGASPWQVRRYIIFPLSRPYLASLFFIKMMESLRSFDFIYVITRGGPGTVTETVDLYAYLVGVAMGGRISYAATISILMLFFTVIITTIIWRIYRKWYPE